VTEIVDVTGWVPAEDPEWMGTRWKVWLKDPQVEGLLWLFKAVRCKELPDGSRRCFEEDWAEYLATRLACRLGLPAAPVRLARWSRMNGIISRSLLQDDDGEVVADSLEHGNELLQAADPTYDKDQRGHATGYTLDAVLGALDGVGVPPACRPPLSEAGDVFGAILILDALVANTDRHHENWGALVRGSKRWLAPTFDQGTCLGFQGPDDMRLRYLGQTSGHGMEVWVRRGHSNHFEGRPGLVELAADALRRVSDAVARHWVEQITAVDLDWWWDTIAAVPEDRMSHPARRFAFEVVRLNRERLLDVYGAH
jgi:hypothetical protein